MILLELFLTFFKIGLFTFGGGYAMLPLIQAEVTAKNWMPLSELVDFVAVSESTPGPFAVNVATYIGTELSGVPGAIAATLGVVMPSFLVILLVARVYEAFNRSLVVRGVMSGLKPAVIGLIASAVISIGQTVLFPEGIAAIGIPSLLCSLAIFAVSLLLIFKAKLHPILIILISAVIGIVAGLFIFS